MNFDSIFFLGVFLPLTVLLYWGLGKTKIRPVLLLCLSLLFYSFGNLKSLMVLAGTIIVNYVLGKLGRRSRYKKFFCGAAVGLNLLLLLFYKYLHFLFGWALPEDFLLIAPVGISFFVFKAISYSVDLYKNPDMESGRLLDFALYISFFPQITAGPITRFRQFEDQIRVPSPTAVAPGLRRFVIGLSKKVILSATLAGVVGEIYGLETVNFQLAWLGAISYMLQIYLDFSGYSDMAIGLGEMLGFTTPENFNYPYTACSITDFWRRWHISLSSWFRDYLYIPLGGNRKGRLRTVLHKFAVFLFCGLWHGASWTFVLWGIWHGLLSGLESLKKPEQKSAKGPGRLLTLLMVCLGFVMFRAQSVSQGFSMLGAMFTGFGVNSELLMMTQEKLMTAETVFTVFTGAFVCCPWKAWLGSRPRLGRCIESVSYPVCLLLFLLCILRLASGNFVPFIYAQF